MPSKAVLVEKNLSHGWNWPCSTLKRNLICLCQKFPITFILSTINSKFKQLKKTNKQNVKQEKIYKDLMFKKKSYSLM